MRRFARFAAGCGIWAAAGLIAGCGEGEPAPSGANPFAGSPAAPAPVAPPRPVASEQVARNPAPAASRTQRPPGPPPETSRRGVPTTRRSAPTNGAPAGNGRHRPQETGSDPEPAPATTEHDQAIAAATRMIQDNPRAAHVAYNNRAVAYYQKGDLPRALADLNKAIGLNPEYAEAYMNRGVVYEQLRNSNKAQADFAKARQLSQ